MATDPTEPELDLSWLEEMPAADEDEEIGAANLEAPPSSLQLEALLTNQAETRAAIASLQVELYRQLATLAAEIAALKGELHQQAKQTYSACQELQADVTSQTVAVQELYAQTQISQSQVEYLLQRIQTLSVPLTANETSQLTLKQLGLQTSRRQRQPVLLTFNRWSIVLLLLAQSIIVASVTAFLLSQIPSKVRTVLPPQQSTLLRL